MCSDVHIPTMHDSKFRITTFMDAMKETNPDFIIELGDFAEISDTDYFKIWNSFHWDKFHVIGNHETDGGHTLAQALAVRKMKNSFYSFDKCGFHFVVLDGNDKKDDNVKGYRQFIGKPQIEWLEDDLAKAVYPVIIFSHQGLVTYQGAEADYGIENGDQVRKIIEDHNTENPPKRVIACFNGHTHWDYVEKINEIWYIHINSMAYNWLGGSVTQALGPDVAPHEHAIFVERCAGRALLNGDLLKPRIVRLEKTLALAVHPNPTRDQIRFAWLDVTVALDARDGAGLLKLAQHRLQLLLPIGCQAQMPEQFRHIRRQVIFALQQMDDLVFHDLEYGVAAETGWTFRWSSAPVGHHYDRWRGLDQHHLQEVDERGGSRS